MEQYRERVIALGLSPGSAIPPISDMDDPVRYRKSTGMKGRDSSEDMKHSSEVRICTIPDFQLILFNLWSVLSTS